IANRDAWVVPWKRKKIEQIGLLLAGALRAEAQVGLKMNVPSARLQEVIGLLPAITAPTVSNLYGTDWFAVESVAAEATVRDLIPRLLHAGAVGIIESPSNKIVGKGAGDAGSAAGAPKHAYRERSPLASGRAARHVLGRPTMSERREKELLLLAGHDVDPLPATDLLAQLAA